MYRLFRGRVKLSIQVFQGSNIICIKISILIPADTSQHPAAGVRARRSARNQNCTNGWCPLISRRTTTAVTAINIIGMTEAYAMSGLVSKYGSAEVNKGRACPCSYRLGIDFYFIVRISRAGRETGGSKKLPMRIHKSYPGWSSRRYNTHRDKKPLGIISSNHLSKCLAIAGFCL